MQKTTIVLLLAIGFLLAPVSAHAIHLCWDTGINLLDVYVTNVAGDVFEVNGILNGDRPVAGTAYRGADEITLSVGIVQASAFSDAVVWQLDLDPGTLDGTGYFRWYDGSLKGPITATNVSCADAVEHFGPGDLSTGVQ